MPISTSLGILRKFQNIKKSANIRPIFKERMLTQVTLNQLAWHLPLINQVKEQKVDTGFEQ